LHSLRRNLTSGVLSPSRVPLFAPARRRALATLVYDLGLRSKGGGGVVVVVECLQFAVFSLLTHMCFGRRLHARRVGEIEVMQRELFASSASWCSAGGGRRCSPSGGGRRSCFCH
jgi:hypothetical protein